MDDPVVVIELPEKGAWRWYCRIVGRTSSFFRETFVRYIKWNGRKSYLEIWSPTLPVRLEPPCPPDHTHLHSMRGLIRAPSSSRRYTVWLPSRVLGLPGAFRRLGAQIEQLLALWMTRMMRRLDLRRMVRLGYKVGLEWTHEKAVAVGIVPQQTGKAKTTKDNGNRWWL